MAQFKVSGNMKVKTLKEEFRANYGAELRVYYKNHFADEEATLASIREGDVKGGEFECGDHDLVGTFENFMKELYGLQVQVASPDNKKLVDNNMKLCDLVNIKAVKERGAREKVTFIFNGNEYTIKGRLCQAIMRYYADQHPEARLEDIQKVFDLGKKDIIFVSYEQAMETKDSTGKPGGGYYLTENDAIEVRGGKAYSWNYFPKTYFEPFMKIVDNLGYEVKFVGSEINKNETVCNDVENAQSEATPSETANTEKKKKYINITVESPKRGCFDYYYDCSDDKYIEMFDDEASTSKIIDALSDDWEEPIAGSMIAFLGDEGEVLVCVKDEDDDVLYDGEVFPVHDVNWDPRQLDTTELPSDMKEFLDEHIEDCLNDYSDDDIEYITDENGQVDWSKFHVHPGHMVDIVTLKNIEKAGKILMFNNLSSIYSPAYLADIEIELDEDEEFDISKLELYITDHDVTECWEDCVSSIFRYGNKFYHLYGESWEVKDQDGHWYDKRD